MPLLQTFAEWGPRKAEAIAARAKGLLSNGLDKLDKLVAATHGAAEPNNAEQPSQPEGGLNRLPPEMLHLVLQQLEPEALACTVPLVCRAWRDAARDPRLWAHLLSAPMLAQVEALRAAGHPAAAPHAWLALSGRNLLRNPGFRKDSNSTLELGRPAWNKWQRYAWVVTSATEDAVVWEAPPQGLTPPGQHTPTPACDAPRATLARPPAPMPYAGGGLRLPMRVQQQLGAAGQQLTQHVSSLLHNFGKAVAHVASSASAAALPPPPPAAAAPAEGAADPAQGPGSPTGAAASAQDAAAGHHRGEPEPAAASGSSRSSQQGGGEGVLDGVSCLATAEDWAEVVQVVDLDWELQRRGLSAPQAAQLLDAGLGLRLSVHVGCRSECQGQFSVGLMLDEGAAAGAEAVPRLHSFVMRPTRHRFFSGKVRCAQAGGWEQYTCAVDACPRGVRRALVMLRGRAAPVEGEREVPLPPFGGAKFSCAELVFV